MCVSNLYKGSHFDGVFTLITLALCPITQRFFRATNILIMLKAHKPVVYFLEFSALDLLELTEEPEVVATSHMSLER